MKKEEKLEEAKWEFLNNEILTISIAGAFSRGNIYKNNGKISEEKKDDFKTFLRDKLIECSRLYEKEVKSEQHIQNIRTYSDDISDKYETILRKICLTDK